MARLFGTDGVRGIAGSELTVDLALNIGKSLGYILSKNNKDIKVLIGCDTRKSKDMLVSGLCAGLTSIGVNVINVGIVTTPAISYLVGEYKANAGIMVTASHNPYEYNGIKIFNENGYKLDDNLEDEIQEIIENIDKIEYSRNLGTIKNDEEAINKYIDFLASVKEHDLSNLNIAIDCSNGSSSVVAPKLFEKLGVKHIILNNNFDGENINKDCGSTHIENLKDYVLKNGYDIGFAFDGDADRCLCIDNKGNEIDGDYILAIISNYLKENNKLKNNTVVGTIMSNLGFINYCKENNINFIPTKVGDRYVLEEMLLNDYSLGGEQSGHVILKEFAKTGDGELTAIEILNVMASSNKSLEELSKIMEKYPQVLVNVKVRNEKKNEFYTNPKVKEEMKQVEGKLKDTGRLVVRPSGTEPLIRVMIEGKNIEEITILANELGRKIEEILK